MREPSADVHHVATNVSGAREQCRLIHPRECLSLEGDGLSLRVGPSLVGVGLHYQRCRSFVFIRDYMTLKHGGKRCGRGVVLGLNNEGIELSAYSM